MLYLHTCLAGTIHGVGKLYLQSVVDAQGSLAFARLTLSKAPMTVLDTLYSCVLPFCEEKRRLGRARAHRHREQRLRPPLRHFYSLYLDLNQIELRGNEVRLHRPTGSGNDSTAPSTSYSSPWRFARPLPKASISPGTIRTATWASTRASAFGRATARRRERRGYRSDGLALLPQREDAGCMNDAAETTHQVRPSATSSSSSCASPIHGPRWRGRIPAPHSPPSCLPART